jgi:cellulose biosynthesis protein BcsQ
MAYQHSIEMEGLPVPIIAFFGTRGGVGKSTISQYTAELILSAPGYNGKPPNVLLIDMDVNSKQLTQHYIEQHVVPSCPTIHELVRLNDASKATATNVTSLVEMQVSNKARPHGELFFIPSAKREHLDVYAVGAQAHPDQLCKLLSDIIQTTVSQNSVSCVVIDCTAGVDNYTAAAATIADVAFCVSLVEPKAFDRIDEQSAKISHINADFDKNKLKTILNKSHRKDRIDLLKQTRDVFHYIPYTDELVRGEGFEEPDELRMAIFKDYVVQLCEKVFRHRWSKLIPPPSVTVPPQIAVLSQVAHKLDQSPGMKRLRVLQNLKVVGICCLALSIVGLIYVSRMGSSSQTSTSEVTDSIINGGDTASLSDREATSSYTAMSNVSILGLIAGLSLFVWGSWASRRYKDMLEAINALKLDVVWVIKQLEEKDMRQRQRVQRLLKLATRLPEIRHYLQSLRLS